MFKFIVVSFSCVCVLHNIQGLLYLRVLTGAYKYLQIEFAK